MRRIQSLRVFGVVLKFSHIGNNTAFLHGYLCVAIEQLSGQKYEKKESKQKERTVSLLAYIV
jgi:hypothetical protein